MLNLIFKKKQLDSASIPVRWCLDEESLAAIKSTGLIPYVLIEIKYAKQSKSSFSLHPLDQLTAYLDVHFPGNVNIRAHVVTADGNKKEALQKCFVVDSYHREQAIQGSSYNVTVGRHDENVKVDTYDGSEWYTFEVSENLFGKEYPNWIKFLINRYYESKPKDQCHQRRRLLFFPFSTMWVVLIEFLAYELLFLPTYLLMWTILMPMSAEAVLHPFDTSMYQFKYDFRNSKSLIAKAMRYAGSLNKQYEFSLAMIVMVLMAPLTPVYAVGLISILMDITTLTIGQIVLVWFFGTYAIALAAAILFFVLWGVSIVFKAIIEGISNWMSDHTPKFCNFIVNIVDNVLDAWDRFENWIINYGLDDINDKLLTCPTEDGDCLPPIRWRDKTLAVMFADVKNKVCKPMRG